MEGSYHVNWNSIICRKGEIHRTEIERLFLTAKGFNSYLVQFLLTYHVIISNGHACSFMISHLHGHASKMICVYEVFCTESCKLWRPVHCKTIFSNKVALDVMIFFIWRKNNLLFSKYLDFCVFVKSIDYKICDVITGIAT